MIIVWDSETTGLLMPGAADVSLQPQMIEFHGIKLNLELEVIDTLSFRCKPSIPISEGASRVNGITNEMLVDAKPFTSYYTGLAEFFMGTHCEVAHNALFDKMILWYELVRIGRQMNFPYPITTICTVEVCQKQLGHRQTLTDMHERLFGRGFEGAHTASGDCEITMKCFVEFVRRGVITL